MITRDEAWQLLCEYNKEPFHLRHGEVVEGVMRYFARQLPSFVPCDHLSSHPFRSNWALWRPKTPCLQQDLRRRAAFFARRLGAAGKKAAQGAIHGPLRLSHPRTGAIVSHPLVGCNGRAPGSGLTKGPGCSILVPSLRRGQGPGKQAGGPIRWKAKNDLACPLPLP